MLERRRDEARRRVLHFLPPGCWPESMASTLLHPKAVPLRYIPRINAVCFLVGNGVAHADISLLLSAMVRSDSARRHVESLLRDIAEGRYDRRWYYYDVRVRDFRHLDGSRRSAQHVCSRRQDALNRWEEVVARCWRTGRSYPSYREQLEFFGARR